MFDFSIHRPRSKKKETEIEIKQEPPKIRQEPVETLEHEEAAEVPQEEEGKEFNNFFKAVTETYRNIPQITQRITLISRFSEALLLYVILYCGYCFKKLIFVLCLQNLDYFCLSQRE